MAFGGVKQSCVYYFLLNAICISIFTVCDAQSLRGGQFIFTGNTNSGTGGNTTCNMQQGNISVAGGPDFFSGNWSIPPVVVVPAPVVPSNISSNFPPSGGGNNAFGFSGNSEPPTEQGNGGSQESP